MHGDQVFSAPQPFGKCLDGYLISDTFEFYLVDASDADNVIRKKISQIDNVELASDKNRLFESLTEIKMDWESALMNQLKSSSTGDNTIRASSTAMYRTGKNCRHTIRAALSIKSVETFEKEHVKPMENIYEPGLGFVGGSMILSSGSEVKIEIRNSDNKEEIITAVVCTELPPWNRPQFPLRNDTTLVILPCENLINRKYSVNALYYNGSIFQYDLESGKFKTENPIPFSNECDKTFSLTGSSRSMFGVPGNEFYPFLEGERLRVFALQNRRLYELVWNQDHTQIELVKHLEFCEISSIVRLESFGFLVSEKSNCLTYTPQPFNIQNSKGEGEVRKLSIPASTNYLYSPISKTIISKEKNEYNKIISLSEIEQIKSEKIKEIFNEEEYLENLKKDLAFDVYVPKLITDSLACVNNVDGRATKAYQIKEEKYNDFEIIAGIRCKDHMDKLGEIISTDYIELEPEDFANYLGAPIMYKSDWSDVLEYKNHIKDMVDCKRSSKQISVACIGRGFSSNSSVDLKTTAFIGIVACKEPSASPSISTNTVADTELSTGTSRKEYQVLFDNQEFMIESTSITANDSLADGHPVIIENVRPGKWKWITTNKEKDHVDGGAIDQYLIAQIIAIHSDFYDEMTRDSNLFYYNNNVYREIEGPSTSKDFHPDPVINGWYLMKHGVGVDAGTASFFDSKYYNNMDGFGLALKKKSLLETSFKLAYGNDWSNYLSKQMEQQGYPSKMAAPYGIITSSGYGDGCYSCLFKKSQDGDVIAVRMIFA